MIRWLNKQVIKRHWNDESRNDGSGVRETWSRIAITHHISPVLLGTTITSVHFSVFIYKMGVIIVHTSQNCKWKIHSYVNKLLIPSTWNAVDHSVNINFQGSFVQARGFKGEAAKKHPEKQNLTLLPPLVQWQSPWLSHAFNKYLLNA